MYIYVRNAGTGVNENDVRVVMDFEAPNNSSSAWLNKGKYVARRIMDTTAKTMNMKVYDVSEVVIDADKVVPGGADYQNLAEMTIDARYLWETDDGEIIIVRNAGPFSSLVPTFETNADGKYSWLNSGKYLSSGPGMVAGGVTLTMYKSK